MKERDVVDVLLCRETDREGPLLHYNCVENVDARIGASHPMIYHFTGVQLATERPFPSPTWLLEGLIPGGGWTLLLGPGKVGKSLFAAQLSHALTTGRAFFGAQNRAGPLRVCFVECDTPPAVWQEQLAGLALPEDTTDYLLPVEWGVLVAGISTMREELKKWQPQYVIWDSLEKLFFGMNLAEKEVVGECLSRLRRLCGPAFAVIHHTRKGKPGEDDSSRDAAWGSSFLSHDWTQQVYFKSGAGPVEISGRLVEDKVLLPGRHVVRGPGGIWIRVAPKSYTMSSINPR